LTLEDGTKSLPRNVDKTLPFYGCILSKKMEDLKLRPRWKPQVNLHNVST
jgi:hypothetical protein